MLQRPWIPNGIVTISKAVLPVAGMGTRLLPATKSQPKEMLPVGTKPVVQHVVEELVEEGVDKLLFVTGRKKRSIEDHFDDDPDSTACFGKRGNRSHSSITKRKGWSSSTSDSGGPSATPMRFD